MGEETKQTLAILVYMIRDPEQLIGDVFKDIRAARPTFSAEEAKERALITVQGRISRLSGDMVVSNTDVNLACVEVLETLGQEVLRERLAGILPPELAGRRLRKALDNQRYLKTQVRLHGPEAGINTYRKRH